MKVEIDFIGGDEMDRKTNELMHYCDVFEKGKQFASYSRFVVTGTPDLSNLCNVMADAIKKTGGYAVFIGIRKVDRKLVNSPRTKYAYYLMPGVQTISMKQKGTHGFSLFRDMLTQLGYKAHTDDNMRVITVS